MTGQHSRRDLLRKASLAGVAGAAVAAGVAIPSARATTGHARGHGVTTFVFVTGASGGVSGDAGLTALGHRVLPVVLPGHEADSGQFSRAYQCPQDLEALAAAPSPMAGVTLDDYTDRAVQYVRKAANHGPVVLVGGSMGGATLGRVGNVVPGLIDRIVYDSAFCCVELAGCADYLMTPEGSTSLLLDPDLNAGRVGDPVKLGASRTNWRSADPKFLAAAKAAMAAEADDAEFMALLNSLQPDESLEVPTADARGRADAWGRIPRTYIRHSLDRAIPLALQNKMIEEADALTPDNRFDVRTVRTSHVPTTAGYREIVKILDGLTTP